MNEPHNPLPLTQEDKQEMDMMLLDSELQQARRLIIHAYGHIYQALQPVTEEGYNPGLSVQAKNDIKAVLDPLYVSLKLAESFIIDIYKIINAEEKR